ncbi:phosphatidylglycerol lysyltransferase domain-containing protein [Hyalangium rubrum]|uniref:Phosphatidylglycerol lysyltransferase domain-containing protein n=1 Tax=Hyalangium rubrum TaxID=3103134 RepID=A0ABU5GY09_9BACT|nr:phosphatidylglycerol lysyltransferase domain-containing protein [Hyalangium sp. s54d21]MDY7225584.1 phosphatidylglycerol lysyltransferase domain-containing protein [Hyalangium sp. s54d21]
MKHDLVRAYGSDPISYSTLQGGLSYFETSFGYVAYQRAFGFELTLGPPVCASGDRAELLQRFLRDSRRPLFFYLPRDVAMLAAGLEERRFRVSGMGVDKVMALDAPEREASAKVRGALKKAARAGFEVLEVRPSELSASERERLGAITRAYLRKSAVPVEMHFLNRPLSFDDDGLARMFVLRQGEEARVFGYAVLDPYFDGGRIQGYLLNLIRFEPTRLWGVYYSAVATLASRLRAEGVRQLSLGFCPLVDVDTEGCSPVLARQVRWLERQLAGVGYLARLREIKGEFPGLTPQRYFVTPSPLAVTTLVALLRACRVPFSEILRRSISE